MSHQTRADLELRHNGPIPRHLLPAPEPRTATGCRETLALLHDKAARIAARIDALRAQDPHHHLIDQLTPALHDALSGIEKVGAELEALELPVIHQLAAE